MTVKEFMKKLGLSIKVESPEPRLAESYYKAIVEKTIKGYEGKQKVSVNHPDAKGYTMTLNHPKTNTPVVLPHFTAPGVTEEPTGEEFLQFTVNAAQGGFPQMSPVVSNLLVLKTWLGAEKYDELIACEV